MGDGAILPTVWSSWSERDSCSQNEPDSWCSTGWLLSLSIMVVVVIPPTSGKSDHPKDCVVGGAAGEGGDGDTTCIIG